MSIHYSTVNFPLKILSALFALTVFFFSLSIPACAEENTEPAGPSQAEMDEAYDEAMMQADSEITFYTMEDLNYRLAVIMKFVSGKMTDEWEEYMESLSGDTDAAEEFYGQLPLESRAEYLEAAYNVDNAIWSVLRNELGDSLSGMIDLVSDISSHLEKGAETISNAFSLIDKIKVFASVGTDNERYEKRIGLQEIKTRFTLLQQILLVACNAISSGS